MTLVILNPHAGGGRAGRVWRDLEPILWRHLGRLVVAVTEHPHDVVAHLDKAADAGLTRVIAIGGDGTNHVLVNALARWNQSHPGATPFVYGNLPLGTGQDWARGLGVPRSDLDAAARWIAEAQPIATDLAS